MVEMYAWGRADSGQLALGETEDEHVHLPLRVPYYEGFTSKVVDVACGSQHTVFLTDDGMVYTCGSNDSGQLGHGKVCRKPERIDSIETMTIKQVACGQDFTLALSDKGKVLSWGNNRKGQLGHTHRDIIHRPRTIKHFSEIRVTQVCCGTHHSLALVEDGRLFSWGDNSHGQLGTGQMTPSSSPIIPCLVDALTGVPLVEISAGGYHSMTLSISGAVIGWGKNDSGQLGLDNGTDQWLPVQIELVRSQRVKHIACGEDHTALLTEDGGVFTFGSGTNGQLGHNSNSHQNQPKKVVELMGTLITQIVCGRRHTVAFAPQSGRVYSFGLGAYGQLGSGGTNSCNSPVVADGPWTTPIIRVVAGGDHCFVLTANTDAGTKDMRMINLRLSIIHHTVVEEIEERIRNRSSISSEHGRKLEAIFSNQQCLNSCFFNRRKNLVTDNHNHAVDLSAARRFFQALASHPQVNEMVLNALEKHLIPSLRGEPIDVDCLRLYVILPEYEMFRAAERYKTLAVPLAKKLLSLHQKYRIIIGNWWAKLPSTYIERIIKIFQECVKFILEQQIDQRDSQEFTVREECLRCSLEILEGVHKVNQRAENSVPYPVFYIPELTDCLDLRSDYLRWVQNVSTTDNKISEKTTLSFCKYPFVFDPKAKYLLLQIDASMQMQMAFRDAHQANIGNLLFNGGVLPQNAIINPFLVLRVRRENIVQDTLSQVIRLGPMEYKKPLQIVFQGEQAVDAGGVKKEFFLLLMRDILDPKYGMFKTIEENRLIWFNKQSFEEEMMFLLIGVICGLAIYNSIIIDLPFPALLYNKLLKRPITLDDFRTFQPSVARNLQQLLDYPEEEVESAFCLNFQVNEEYYGVISAENLIPDGENVPVTGQNRDRYVDAYIDYIVNKSVEKHFIAFSNGFHRVCGGRVLEFFHPQELMEMVVGIQDYDFNELKEGAEYLGEYYSNHPVIKNFWDVFNDFEIAYKKKFLVFLTGTDRVPLTGIRSLNIKIQPVSGGVNNEHLPVAHTCFNLLDLPRYPTQEMMKQKLEQAISFSSGFGLA
ncbi:probable E3 ubiquitin-protein ligase HERC4 [Dendronephthya gigantea]|uniref:probable E3 ubiquitin-protein ligase HERC4 n=1 Tax=Dendronephthya gigantea TaxID=151771 RepID=UPI00106B8A02|nr:probable E3 ubiquitin-protein ligase HERC4 [Dendronephthya gigantea]